MNLRRNRLAAVDVSVQAVARFVRRGAADIVLVVVIEIALVGIHLLRRAARAQLRYRRLADSRRRASALR